MRTINLNSAENQVYEACKSAAKKKGDNGYELCLYSVYGFFDTKENPSERMKHSTIKGYLGQLVQKQLIEKFDDCYFDFGVLELVPDYLRYRNFDHDVEISINE